MVTKIQTVVLSDRTGEAIESENRVKLTIRTHPDIVAPKVVDLDIEELNELPSYRDAVNIEIKHPDGSVAYVSVSTDEFEPFLSSSIVVSADSNRGRRTGSSPLAAMAR